MSLGAMRVFRSLFVARFYSSFKAERPQDIKTIVSAIGIKSPITEQVVKPKRTWKDVKNDLTDIEKNKQRREELKQEFFKSTFDNIYNFRHTGGRIFHAPKYMFKASASLYMPNIAGTRIDGDSAATDTSLIPLLSRTKPNVIRLFSSRAGQDQIDEYVQDPLLSDENFVNRVDINIPTSWTNRMLVKLFSGSIRKTIPKNTKYLIGKEIPNETAEALRIYNKLAGYLYLVDKDLKVRWAAAGPPIDDEKARLVTYLNELQ